MSVSRGFRKVGHVTGVGMRDLARGGRAGATGVGRGSRWCLRLAASARRRSGGGSMGLMRLLDLHAASCAGDILVAIGLAGTIFFVAPATEARGQVGLYLGITMVPFAVLAPVIGPVLDRFRHGRRYALAATVLGRAVLAWVLADNFIGLALYPAAFGVLLLSRAYGVARGAAVPRLLPPGFGLSEAGARASVYASIAGGVIAPIGAAAFWFGPQWPLRLASLVFLAGAVLAMRLPARTDSDPPVVTTRIFQVPWRHTEENGNRVLSGRLVLASLGGGTVLRLLQGFLLTYFAFAIRERGVPGDFLGLTFGPQAQLAVAGAALGIGAFVATVMGSNLRIRKPVRVQALGASTVALAAIWASMQFALPTAALLCFVAAIAAGLGKLAVDVSIQERVPETVRSSAFAHSETVLMLAWVAGAGVGLIPVGNPQLGLGLATVAVVLSALWGTVLAVRLRKDRLFGHAAEAVEHPPPSPAGTPFIGTLSDTRAGAHGDSRAGGYGDARGGAYAGSRDGAYGDSRDGAHRGSRDGAQGDSRDGARRNSRDGAHRDSHDEDATAPEAARPRSAPPRTQPIVAPATDPGTGGGSRPTA